METKERMTGKERRVRSDLVVAARQTNGRALDAKMVDGSLSCGEEKRGWWPEVEPG